MSIIARKLMSASGGGGSNYFIAEIVAGDTDPDRKNMPLIALDSADNIYTSFQYVVGAAIRLGVVKFDPAGSVEAQNSITSFAQVSRGLAGSVYGTIVDSSGDLRITGKDSSGAAAVVTLSTSNLSLSSSFKATLTGYTVPGCAFFDSSGNVYVSGYNGTTAVLAKYNSSGVQQFAQTYVIAANSGSATVFGQGGTVDSSGNVYFGGTHTYYGSYAIYFKLNSSGVFQHARSAYSSSHNNFINDIRVDGSGNIYAVGTLPRTDSGVGIPLIIKYDSSGTLLWYKTHGVVADPQEGSFQSLAFDSGGNIYVAGEVSEAAGVFAGSYRGLGLFAKYNSSGALQWSRGVGPPVADSSVNGTNARVVVDSKDDLILTCSQQTGTNASSTYVLRVPNDGTLTGTYTDVKYGTTGFGHYTLTPGEISSSLTSSGTDTLSTGSISGTGSSTTFTNAIQII